MAEVGMKSRPAGPGRDEFSRSHSSSHSLIRFPFLYPPSEVRIWRFGQILTSLERFRVVIAKFGILSTQRIPGLGISSTQRIPEIGILSTQRIPGLRGFINLKNPIRKRYSSQKIFPLRGQFIHCDFIYTKNSRGATL